MNIILLSGGSGKRLWPLSNDVRSKQFIKIFKAEGGAYESMAQRFYRQIHAVDQDAFLVIAAPKSQASVLRSQLSDTIDLSIEPCRRDTFPAIVLASAYLYDVKGVSMEEPVVVCPVDAFAGDSYFEMLKEMSLQAAKGEANLVLMGIQPTYPSEKYGYVLPEHGGRISRAAGFREKPTVDTARDYIQKGALWNGGIFAFKLGYILKKAHEMITFSSYYDLFSRYEMMPGISFDYAVVEKEAEIQVIRYSGQWKDLGTWNTLTESMEDTAIGTAMQDQTCSNVHILNELGIPVLAMGLRDVVISASPQGILVSDKEQSSYIKPFVDKLEQQVMFAEKSWGSYRVLDIEAESLTIKVTLQPGRRMNYHSHKYRDEVWTVISGTGYTIVDGIKEVIQVGDVITVQAGCRHTVAADTKLVLIEVQLGKEISADDKQKYPRP